MSAPNGIHWPMAEMRDVCVLHYGKALTEGRRRSGNVPVYGTNGRTGWHDASLALGPSVILGRKGQGNLGVEWVDGPFWVIDTGYHTTFSARILPRFFYYYVDMVGLNHLKDGTSNPSLSRDLFGRQPIPLPPLDEQARIVAILSALDDKIKLNRRMSATLEGMARALFRSWFVDFDPVQAKARGEAPAHMDPATAALFPDRFGENGLPEGWRREPVGQHINVRKGLSYKGEGLCDESDGVPLHNLNSIYEGGGYKDEGIKFYRGDHKPRHEVRPGDLVVANTEQGFDELLIGHSALIPEWLGPSGIFSHHLYKIELKTGSPLSKEWWYLALSCSLIGATIRSFSNGTTVNMLPADAFELPLVAVPSLKVVSAMDSLVRPMLRKQGEARAEARTLAALRDALLPKLMSGEIRVRDAARLAAEAV